MKHKKIFTLFAMFATGFSIIFTGCRKFVDIPPASNLIVSSQVFADSTNASAAINAIYISMMRGNTNLGAFTGNITAYTGLSSDELYSTRGFVDENTIYANAIPATNSSIAVFWSDYYSVIYKANACIEGITSSSGITTSVKNQFIGEAKIVRAFCFFNLVNLYGAVPLTTTTDYKVNAALARTSPDLIYKQIVDDLLSAESLLTENYPSAGRARPNKYVAIALLSKVYLYQKQWANAEAASSQIINSGKYSLVADLNNVFIAGSNEAIWQMVPTISGYETAEGFVFVPTTTTVKPKYVIANNLLNSFETNDQRKINWLKSNTIGGLTYFFPYKYKLGQDKLTTPKENYMVFRLAEQYLIRAEARAQLGSIANGISDLNIVRNRAGVSNSNANDQSSLLNAIYHERQVELFCEWGNRWFDLKRIAQIDVIMNVITPTKGGIWNTTAQLYPIYYSELQNNPNLIQNPGY